VAPKRFIVYGAGAIGGVLGSLLHRAGHEVVLIARGPHLEAIRAQGLRLVTAEGDQVVRVPALAGPHELEHRPGDVVLLAMKSMDTEAALRALAPVVAPETPIVCVQNGVANERAALRLFPHVYGVCVMFPATHLEPGVVQAGSWPVPALLDIGRYQGDTGRVPPDETAAEVAAAFRSTGCHSEPRPDIMRWKYRKLVMNLGNAVDALVGRAEGAADVTEAIRVEGERVLEAAGIPVASREEDRARRGDILRLRPIEGRPRGGSSSWQSLARGTGSIEADYLNGEIVLLGRLHGVEAPLNEAVRRLAVRFAREGRPPGSMPVEELRVALDRAAENASS